MSQRLIVNGLYENYFVYIICSVASSILFLLLLYESLPIIYWLVLIVFLGIGNLIFYNILLHKTKKGQIKNYPKKQIRIYNKDF